MTIGLPSEKPGEPLPTQPVIVTNLFAGSALVWANAGAAIIAAIPQSTIVFMGASSLIHECKGSAVAARLGYAMESRHAALVARRLQPSVASAASVTNAASVRRFHSQVMRTCDLPSS